MDNLTEKLMCVNCTEDEYLKKLIQSEGERGRCDYCEEEDTCISLEELAPRVKEIFEERFRAVQHFGGKDPADVFQEIGSFFNDETGRDILHMLESEGDIYDYGERFVRKEIRSVETKAAWDVFCTYVKHGDRYFSEEAPQLLDELFVKLIPLRSEKNRSPFRNLRPSKSRRIYRGRVVNSHSELQRIMLNPAIELGPPPAKIAPAGRLNPMGIPSSQRQPHKPLTLRFMGFILFNDVPDMYHLFLWNPFKQLKGNYYEEAKTPNSEQTKKSKRKDCISNKLL